MGFIISIGEVLYFAPQFVSFINGELSLGREIATVATIILVVLMIPLMLTSFYCVRTNMKPKTWKRLQSTHTSSISVSGCTYSGSCESEWGIDRPVHRQARGGIDLLYRALGGLFHREIPEIGDR